MEVRLNVDTWLLVRHYIPLGWEIRVGMVELLHGTLQALPKCEYFVSFEDPIRISTRKYTEKDDWGEPTLLASWRKRPADVDLEPYAQMDC